MTVSTRTRFEVFKRDRFTCHYCGRTPPAVLLEVDHVLPRAAGGTDDGENLITACQDCNRGKAANLLDEGSAPTVSHAAVTELQDRIDQAKAYAELMQQMRGLVDDQISEVIEHWARVFGAVLEEQSDGAWWVFKRHGYGFPKETSIRTILRLLPLHEVLDAIDIAAGWGDGATDRTRRYFYGVCWHRIRDRDDNG